jgi:hypothetical protein
MSLVTVHLAKVLDSTFTAWCGAQWKGGAVFTGAPVAPVAFDRCSATCWACLIGHTKGLMARAAEEKEALEAAGVGLNSVVRGDGLGRMEMPIVMAEVDLRTKGVTWIRDDMVQDYKPVPGRALVTYEATSVRTWGIP